MILFFDTETTGKADLNSPDDAPHQPRLVQLACVLTEDTGERLASLALIVKPDGFEIPDEAAKIHGITTEKAVKRGVPLDLTLDMFRALALMPKTIVSHNIAFDYFILSAEYHRQMVDCPLEGAVQFCTMKALIPICKLPNQYGYSDYKWPKLKEAYSIAFGTPLEDAHDALADTTACMKLYFWLREREDKEAEALLNG